MAFRVRAARSKTAFWAGRAQAEGRAPHARRGTVELSHFQQLLLHALLHVRLEVVAVSPRTYATEVFCTKMTTYYADRVERGARISYQDCHIGGEGADGPPGMPISMSLPLRMAAATAEGGESVQ